MSSDLRLKPGDVTAELRLPGAGLGAGIGLAVLSVDNALLDTIEEVVTADHAISIAQNELELTDLIVSSRCGVALIDAAAVPAGEISALTARLRAQFPDLVLIVAGGAEHQGALAAQIASSEVYRFLHKPVSAQRIKAFVDASLRRHDEEHAAIKLEAERVAAEQAQAARERAASARTGAGAGGTIQAGSPQQRWIIGAVAAGLAIIAGIWFATREDAAAPQGATASAPAAGGAASTAPRGATGAGGTAPQTANAPARPLDDAARKLLGEAERALKQGRLVAPPESNAAALYGQVLARFPNDPQASAGLESVVAALLTAAEQALAAGRLDEAGRAVESARVLRPDNVRVAFVQAQLGKERERELLARNRAAAASGQIERQQLEERARASLRLAEERLRSGALLEPSGDNARFHLESARALIPRNAEIDRVQGAFRQRLVAEARAALGRDDTTAANRWVRAAAENGVPASDLEALRAQLGTAQTTARAAELTRLASLVTQRISQGRLVDPPNESARSAYEALREADRGGTTADSVRQTLARAFVAESRSALTGNNLEGAQRWLNEAEAIGGAASDLQALRADLDAARVRLQAASSIVGASSLKRTRFVEPNYPRAARAKDVEGWVDLEFTVRPDGGVADVTVVGAEPAGVFDESAVDALRRWRFEPVQREGSAVEQRARLRMRFNVD